MTVYISVLGQKGEWPIRAIFLKTNNASVQREEQAKAGKKGGSVIMQYLKGHIKDY